MIVLNRETANEVHITVTEKTTITNPVYIFRLTSETSNATKQFVSTDVSTNTIRYNKFIIETVEDSGSEDLDNAIVHMILEGFYNYEVYEAIAGSDASTSIVGLNVVESGKCFLNGPEGFNSMPDTIEDIYVDNDQKSYNVYNG